MAAALQLLVCRRPVLRVPVVNDDPPLSYRVKFEGGPADGTLVELPNLPTRYLIPSAPSFAAMWGQGAGPGDVLARRVAAYEPIYNGTGLPSLSDQGVYRYQYRGMS